MDALRELAKLLDRGRELVDREREGVPRLEQAPLRRAKLQQQGDQTLLRPVMQVSLEPTARIVRRGEDKAPAGPDQPRPTEFAAKLGSGQTLMVLRREGR